jgi:hypothetical protein
VQSPGIEVADFLAVRPEHRGDDDGGLPSDLKNERFFRSSSRKSPSADFQKWPYGVFSGDGLGLVCLRELASTPS